MTGMWPTLIAVLGTLAGGLLGFIYQSRAAQVERRNANSDRLHAERLEACAQLGASLVAYRHSQLARQTHRLRDGDRSEVLTDEVRQCRGDAWSAYFRVELLAVPESVLQAAGRAMAEIRELKNIQDSERLDVEAEAARQSIQITIRAARDSMLGAGLPPAQNRRGPNT